MRYLFHYLHSTQQYSFKKVHLGADSEIYGYQRDKSFQTAVLLYVKMADLATVGGVDI